MMMTKKIIILFFFSHKKMTQPVVKERILEDDKTGLCNDKI